MESLILQITIPGQMVFIYGRLIGEGIWPGHALSFWSFSSLSQLQMRPWVTSWLTQASYCEHRTARANISLKAKLIPLTSDLTQATKHHSGMTLLGKKHYSFLLAYEDDCSTWTVRSMPQHPKRFQTHRSNREGFCSWHEAYIIFLQDNSFQYDSTAQHSVE